MLSPVMVVTGVWEWVGVGGYLQLHMFPPLCDQFPYTDTSHRPLLSKKAKGSQRVWRDLVGINVEMSPGTPFTNMDYF